MTPIYAEKIRNALSDLENMPDVYAFSCIDSTNSEAKRMAERGFSGCALIAAASQTLGRGRMGRSFYSPDGSGVYFSILYTPSAPMTDAVRLTSAAAVAVMRAIRNLTGKQMGIKWVNDLYWQGKKVCGILTEALSFGNTSSIILGIGINLSTDFSKTELSQIAGAVGTELPREKVIAECYRQLLPFLADPASSAWLDEYRAHSTVLGRPVEWSYDGKVCSGVAYGIDEDGALLIEDAFGVRTRIFSGEVTVRVK